MKRELWSTNEWGLYFMFVLKNSYGEREREKGKRECERKREREREGEGGERKNEEKKGCD